MVLPKLLDFVTEGQQRVATNVLADDKKVQAKLAKKLAKQQVKFVLVNFNLCCHI